MANALTQLLEKIGLKRCRMHNSRETPPNMENPYKVKTTRPPQAGTTPYTDYFYDHSVIPTE